MFLQCIGLITELGNLLYQQLKKRERERKRKREREKEKEKEKEREKLVRS